MNEAKGDIKKIYTAAIDAVNPYQAIMNSITIEENKLLIKKSNQHIADFDLSTFSHIYVVGAGKATAPMALAIEALLPSKITEGCICVKYKHLESLKKIETIEAAHPIPDEPGVEASKRIVSILEKADENDLVISLISGGGSALLPLPAGSITLEEKKETTDLLLKSGASIHEINTIRKHLSKVKGGNLARAAYPATVINLMISDVVGDNMDVIASGPFVPDKSTFQEALSILLKYDLAEQVSKNVLEHIQKGVAKRIDENPNESSEYFKKITNHICASNIIALTAAKNKSEELGYNSIILSSLIEGETKDVAQWHIRIAKEILSSQNPVAVPACVISGGETTVTITGSGKGGRNMEFAIQSAPLITNNAQITVASIGTDGTDGPTDAAGAIADGFTISKAEEANINIDEYIKNNDSYTFFSKNDDLIKTGPTNTNVMDVRIILITK